MLHFSTDQPLKLFFHLNPIPERSFDVLGHFGMLKREGAEDRFLFRRNPNQFSQRVYRVPGLAEQSNQTLCFSLSPVEVPGFPLATGRRYRGAMREGSIS